MLSKTRTTIIAFVAAFSFAGAAIVPNVASALPPRPGMKSCKLKIGGNFTIQVDDEQEITIKTATNTLLKIQCKDGMWYQVRESSPTTGARYEGEVKNKPEGGSPPRPTEGNKTTSTPPPAAQ